MELSKNRRFRAQAAVEFLAHRVDKSLVVSGITSRMKVTASLLLMALIFAIPAFLIRSPTPDWPSFYAGAKLASEGSARLYSFAASHAITSQFMSPVWVWAFLRPPVYATALYPLGLLKPQEAFLVWQLFNLAAIVAVVALLWRSPLAVVAALSCSPLWTSFKQGQDMPLLVLAAATAIVLIGRKRTYVAGFVLALCGIKFHLLLLIPVFLCVRKAWSLAAGLLSGAVVMMGACCALYGRSWAADYYHCVAENQKHLRTTSLLSIVPSGWWPVALCSVVVLVTAAVCRYSRSDRMALALTLALGLMVAPRFYFYDVAIALPALLVILRGFTQESTQSGAVHHPRPAPPPAHQSILPTHPPAPTASATSSRPEQSPHALAASRAASLPTAEPSPAPASCS